MKGCLLPSFLTFVLWKTDGERTVPDLLREEVLLVEEEDDGGVDEPLVVADGVEELHALHHAVHLLVLGEHEVVAAERHAEDDGRHALEAVDPLLPLRPLTADVEHSERTVLDSIREQSLKTAIRCVDLSEEKRTAFGRTLHYWLTVTHAYEVLISD